MISLSLYDTVFAIPPEIVSVLSRKPDSPSKALAASTLLCHLTEGEVGMTPIHATLLDHIKTDHGAAARLSLGAALTPFYGLHYTQKKRSLPAAQAAIWEGLRVSYPLPNGACRNPSS